MSVAVGDKDWVCWKVLGSASASGLQVWQSVCSVFTLDSVRVRKDFFSVICSRRSYF